MSAEVSMGDPHSDKKQLRVDLQSDSEAAEEGPYEDEDVELHEDRVARVVEPILQRFNKGLEDRGIVLDPRLRGNLLDALTIAYETGLQDDGNNVSPQDLLLESPNMPSIEES